MSGILALLVVLEWRYWPAQPPLSRSVPLESVAEQTDAEVKAQAGFRLPPLDDFETVSQRPLFYEGRRPPDPATNPEPEAAREEAGTDRPELNLKATLIIDAERYALIQSAADNKRVVRLRAGDRYEGWRVGEIRPDRLILEQGKRREEFLLRQYEKVPLPKVVSRRRSKRTKPVKQPVVRRPVPAKTLKR